MPDSFYTPKSAMAIVAHPDDIEFSCAGTLARWAKEGAHIVYVLCISGDLWGNNNTAHCRGEGFVRHRRL